MIYSVIPDDVIFFDNVQVRQRHMKLFNNVTLELVDGRIERIISTNPNDYIKYSGCIGQGSESCRGLF